MADTSIPPEVLIRAQALQTAQDWAEWISVTPGQDPIARMLETAERVWDFLVRSEEATRSEASVSVAVEEPDETAT